MGFPTWTLWGMGAAAAGALLMLVLAYLAQSPRLLKRLQLGGQRLDLRARAFTGYALALLLLAVGFFLAGVPLGPTELDEVAVGGAPPPTPTVVVEVAEALPEDAAPEDAAEAPLADVTGTPRPASGAFVGPRPTAPVEEAALPANAEAEDEAPPAEAPVDAGEEIEAATEADTADEEATVPATATPTETPTATPTVTPSPTATATPLPTETPTPTLTPTPIFEETATVNTGGSTLWLRRTPGGQEFVLLQSNAIVILRDGYANAGGSLWREVSTTDGTIGWVQESFLNFNAVQSGE